MEFLVLRDLFPIPHANGDVDDNRAFGRKSDGVDGKVVQCFAQVRAGVGPRSDRAYGNVHTWNVCRVMKAVISVHHDQNAVL
ncbi:hypothetical protein ACWDGI_30595 [Streptomyces sp. NPDC001220]